MEISRDIGEEVIEMLEDLNRQLERMKKRRLEKDKRIKELETKLGLYEKKYGYEL
jgi:cell division septum initiation protein DivIVA